MARVLAREDLQPDPAQPELLEPPGGQPPHRLRAEAASPRARPPDTDAQLRLVARDDELTRADELAVLADRADEDVVTTTDGGEPGVVLGARDRPVDRAELDELAIVDPREQRVGVLVAQRFEGERHTLHDPMSTVTATWLADVLGVPSLEEGATLTVRGQELVVRDRIPRVRQLLSDDQAETTEMFGFKWTQEDTFTRPEALELMRGWLESRYGRVADAPWWGEYGERPLVLDAGCGAGVSGLEVFGPLSDRVRYLGADLTPAVDVARRRFADRGLDAAFLQADLTRLPLAPGSVDVIFPRASCTTRDSTEGALKAVAPLLRPGGRILRPRVPPQVVASASSPTTRSAARLQEMTPRRRGPPALEPLTKLGIALGELGVEIDVPEDVDVLGIKAGRVDLQRLFYYDVFKAYYDPAMTFGEMHHINFDWYAPKNAFRQTEEEVRALVRSRPASTWSTSTSTDRASPSSGASGRDVRGVRAAHRARPAERALRRRTAAPGAAAAPRHRRPAEVDRADGAAWKPSRAPSRRTACRCGHASTASTTRRTMPCARCSSAGTSWDCISTRAPWPPTTRSSRASSAT